MAPARATQRRRDDVRRLTQVYRHLQGLKLVPMGVAMAGFGVMLLAFPRTLREESDVGSV